MSVDVQRICTFLEEMHELWASVVSLALGMVLLWFQARWAMFPPLVLILVTLFGTSRLGDGVGKYQKAFMGQVDKRIKLLSSILDNLLPLKYSAYEPVFINRIDKLREVEARILQKTVRLIMWSASIGYTGSSMAGPACIGVYCAMLRTGAVSGDLTATRLFSILTVINLLGTPLKTLSNSFPDVLVMLGSVKRIQTLLVLEEKESRECEKEDDVPENSKDMKLENLDRAPLQFEIRNGSFGWDVGKPVLHDINLDVQSGRLHMVVGPVASGKSTLIMSLLGETIRHAGDLIASERSVAYASQSPVIIPGTIRENIIFAALFDQAFYSQVIHACGLQQDLDQLAGGDSTVLNQGGSTLSGGQRQRIGLARAIYARTQLYLLDDVFSALDAHTEAHVFDSLFGSNGMLRGKTVLLVTHAARHLEAADVIVRMRNGSIEYLGPFTGALTLSDMPSDSKGGPDVVHTLEKAADTVKPPSSPPKTSDDPDTVFSQAGSTKWTAYAYFCRAIGWGYVICQSVLTKI